MSRQARNSDDTPNVEPLDVDGVRTVALFTVMWGVAFVVLAVQRSTLKANGTEWWLWTCLAGVGLGLLGLEYTRKRRDAIERARLLAEADLDEEGLDDVDQEADSAAPLSTEGPDAASPTSPALPVRQVGESAGFSRPGQDAVTRPVDVGPPATSDLRPVTQPRLPRVEPQPPPTADRLPPVAQDQPPVDQQSGPQAAPTPVEPEPLPRVSAYASDFDDVANQSPPSAPSSAPSEREPADDEPLIDTSFAERSSRRTSEPDSDDVDVYRGRRRRSDTA